MAVLLLYAAYGFHAGLLGQGIRHAQFFSVTWQAFGMRHAYQRVLAQIAVSGPALMTAVPAALIVYFTWRRTRYFGNTAPLLISVVFLILGVGTPHSLGGGFQLMAVPLLLVFVSGIAADLLETRQRSIVSACVWGLLAANALWNLMELARVGRG